MLNDQVEEHARIGLHGAAVGWLAVRVGSRR
jgi:hypothetical protein